MSDTDKKKENVILTYARDNTLRSINLYRCHKDELYAWCKFIYPPFVENMIPIDTDIDDPNIRRALYVEVSNASTIWLNLLHGKHLSLDNQ